MAARLGGRSIATLSSSIKPASLSATRLFAHNAIPFRLSRNAASRFQSPSIALRAFHNSRAFLQEAGQAAPQDVSGSPATSDEGPVTRFADLGTRRLIDETIVKTITNEMKLETMTDVQAKTIDSCIRGLDVVAQAKTGTGKTLGFLVPIAQRILTSRPELRRVSRGRGDIDIRALIISPTRELAEQIAVEARRLLRNTAVKVQTAVGGTQKGMHLRNMQYEGCHVLVATPGRLQDLLDDRAVGLNLKNLETLVLDEADRLLDTGFAEALYRIHKTLPDRAERARQTLMFSATMPREVMHVVADFMLPQYEFIKTITKDEVPTHDRIPQKIVRLDGMQNTFPAVMEMVKTQRDAMKEQGKAFKAMIFFNANAEAAFYHSMFQNLDASGSTRFATHPFNGVVTVEMHSKLSQSARTRNSDLFRQSKEAIMFTSDVTARGMDFPNVTHVIQIGCPRDRESYIHRIGRTGRAGKEGEGWLFLNPVDEGEARHHLEGLPLKRDRTLQTSSVDMTKDSEMPAEVANVLTQCVKAAQRTTLTAKALVFRAMVGTHQWYRHKSDLIMAMNNMAKYGWGMERPPALDPGLASKLGLSRVRELNTDVQADEDIMRKEELEGRGSSGFFDRGRSGRFGGSRDGRSREGSSRFGERSLNRGSFGRGRDGDRGSFGGGRDGDRRSSQRSSDPWD